MLQVREPYAESLAWAARHGFTDMPLYDTGVEAVAGSVKVSDGSTLPDRYLAQVFPSTYVLDKNGIVLFAHKGAVNDWSQYVDFFADAASQFYLP